MNSLAQPAWIGRYGDRGVTVTATLALALGSVLGLAGAASADLPMLVGGGGLALAGLTFLLAAELVDGLLLILLSAPLPALISNGDSRITLVSILTAVLVFAWALGHGLGRRPVFATNFPLGVTALLAVAAGISVAFGSHPVVSARELLNFGVMLAVFVAAAEILERTGRGRRMAVALVAVGAVVGALAVLEGVGILPGTFRLDATFYRSALGFGQPNALGLFLATVVPFGVYARTAAPTRAWRMVATAAVGAMALGLIATVSRGSWLALVAGAGALAFAGQTRWVVRVWGITLALVIVVDLGTGGLFRDTVERSIGDWVFEQRAALMLAGVSMFLAHPVVGVGLGGFAPNLDRFGAQIPQLFDIKPTPHNAFVQMAAEAGLIGLTIFVLFLGTALWRAIRAARATMRDETCDAVERGYRRAVAWSLATIVLAGMVTWPFAHGPGQVVMVVLAMALVGSDRNG